MDYRVTGHESLQFAVMSTANERRALWFLAAVALSGSAVRLARARTPEVTTDPALTRQLARVDSATARRAERSPGKGPRARERGAASMAAVPAPSPVDIETATAGELDRLPGIGPTLAARIVAHRDSAGRFSDLRGLCQVRGIGPAMAERLRPAIVFFGQPPVANDRCEPASAARRKSR